MGEFSYLQLMTKQEGGILRVCKITEGVEEPFNEYTMYLMYGNSINQ